MKLKTLFVRRLWDRIMRAIERTPVSSQDKLRIGYFLAFVISGVSTMIVYGGYNLYAGNYLLGALVGLSATGLVAGWLVLLRLKNGKIVYRLNGLLLCTLLLYMLAFGGADGSKILWSFTFPLIGIFLLGQLEGLIWSLSLLLIDVVCFFVPIPFAEIYPYSNEFILRFLSTYLIICAITYWFEHFRTSYRRQMETQHQRFEDILEHSREILYRRDLKSGQYLYISKAFSDILGYSRPELEAADYQGIERLIHADDRDQHEALLRQIEANQPSPSAGHIVEYRMRHKDGTYFWFSDQVAVIYDGAGQPASIIGSNREITRERHMKKALKEAKDQLLTVLDSIDAHIYVADMQTYRILFMNSKMQKDFGRNLEGGVCWKEFRNGIEPCGHCTNDLLLDDQHRPTGVHEWECFNPIVKRWYNNYDRAIQWVDGKWVRIQIAVDISRMKEMEAERQRDHEVLRRARQIEAIGTLAGGIAHDFNNLLQVIMGNLSLLECDLGRESDQYGYLHEIKDASIKAKELAGRLITFSTGGAPNLVSRPITRLLQNTTNQLIAGTTVTCVFEIPHDLWPTPIDFDQMTAALKSVINNACDSMADEGHLHVSAENYTYGPTTDNDGMPVAEGSYVKVSIQDNGEGISEALLPKIFEPYFSTKRRGAEKGVGLSLSIAYSIVRQHHGHISVSSQPDQGTRVDIYLPVEIDVFNKTHKDSRY